MGEDHDFSELTKCTDKVACNADINGLLNYTTVIDYAAANNKELENFYPTAIGWESSDTDDEKARQLNAWIISQRAHAVANGLPVISVNRVGHEPDPSGQTNGILFWGNSFVAGPQGEFLAQAGNDHPENMVVEIDMERSENVRRWWPFLRDRRIDEYEGLTKRFLD